MDLSGTKCGSVSGFWEHGSGSPFCDEGGEFLSRWNKHLFSLLHGIIIGYPVFCLVGPGA